jgi:lysophospholipase L1-like esterase
MTTPAVNPLLRKPVAELTPQEIAGMQKTLADWAQLGRYREDDRKLGAPAAGQQRVVFYGDSITDAWGRIRGKFFPDEPWVNRGISGQTTGQMLVRFQQDVLALQPAAVVILAGINDIAGNNGPETLGEIEANFRSMVTLAEASHVRVVISSVLPATRFFWNPGVDPRAEVAALNAWLKQFAAERGAVWLDPYTAMATADGSMRPGLSVDGVHPTDAGYAVMEPLARAAVAQALRQPAP